MKPSSTASGESGGIGPGDIEGLLPFHAAGTLSASDARRVDAALARDPELARQYKVIQDEYAETILLNESLGAPSIRAMQKLLAAIDAEPARASFIASNPVMRIAGFFSGLSSRALAYTAIAGVLAVLLQAGVIGTVLVRTYGGGNIQTASLPTQSAAGTFGLVRFAPDASIGDISQLLVNYDATIVSGPTAGMFRVRFGQKMLSKQDAEQLLARLQNEKIVNLAVPAE